MFSITAWSLYRSIVLVATIGLCLLSVSSAFTQSARPPAGSREDPNRPYALFDPNLTCEQAHKLSRQALEHLRFTLKSDTPTSDSGSRAIKGVREGHLDEENVTVTITCGDDGVRIDSDSDLPPCEQANRVSYRAVERQGFTVTSFSPASDGGSGMVKGVRGGPEGQESVTLTVTCGADAVFIDTSSEDNPLLSSEDFYLAIGHFRRGFYAMLNGMAEHLQHQTISEVQPQNQMQVVMKPLVASEAQFEFGTDIMEVFPVRVEISNTTKLTYVLEAERIMLLTPSGDRVKPVSPANDQLSAQAITSQTLAPGTNVKGYLYYPLGSYTGARGSITEEKSQEREGFAIQF